MRWLSFCTCFSILENSIFTSKPKENILKRFFKIKITKIPLKIFERRTKVKRLLSSCTYFSTLKKFYFYIKILGEYFKRIFKN